MTEQQRNPYTPTNVPLVLEKEPRTPGPDEELEYGGFWIRVGAVIIDTIILIPVGVLNAFAMFWSRSFAIGSFALGLLVTAFYWIYLVQRFGGTPGKRILSMRVAMQDGSPITMAAAIVRYAPTYVLTTISSVASLVGLFGVSSADFESQGILGRLQVYGASQPAWGQWVGYVLWLWLLTTAIVMLCNNRRRALHDYIAGTVVLRER